MKCLPYNHGAPDRGNAQLGVRHQIQQIGCYGKLQFGTMDLALRRNAIEKLNLFVKELFYFSLVHFTVFSFFLISNF